MASQYKLTVTEGGTYPTLAAAIAQLKAIHPNLVADDVYCDVEIDGTWSDPDTADIDIIGLTTDATRYVNIYTTPTTRHPGYYVNSSPYYRMVGNAGGNGRFISIGASYVSITGIQIYNITATPSSSRGINISDGVGNVVLDKMVVKGSGCALRNWNYTAGNLVKNSVLLTTGTDEGTVTSLGDLLLYNSVIVNLGGQWGVNTNATCTNCYVYSATGTSISAGTPTTTATNDGAQSTTVVSYSSVTGAYFTNVTSGSEDFHISSSSSLKDVGTDLSSTFTDDIDGNTRTVPWSIGIDAINAPSRPPATRTGATRIEATREDASRTGSSGRGYTL